MGAEIGQSHHYGRQEYLSQRKLFYHFKGKVDRYSPLPLDDPRCTRNDKAFWSLSHVLCGHGYNPIQAIRHVFKVFMSKGFQAPEPHQAVYVDADPGRLQEETNKIVTSMVESSLAKMQRLDIDAEFILPGKQQGGKLDPDLIMSGIDPVIRMYLKINNGFEVRQDIVDSAAKAYLCCPSVYKAICPAMIPDNIGGLVPFEDICHAGTRGY